MIKLTSINMLRKVRLINSAQKKVKLFGTKAAKQAKRLRVNANSQFQDEI
jgi:hypothetical protein